MSTAKRISVTLCALTLAACGKSSDVPTKATGTLSSESAAQLLGNQQDDLAKVATGIDGSGASHFTSIGSGALASRQLRRMASTLGTGDVRPGVVEGTDAFASCGKVLEGDTTDADSDGVKAKYKVQMDCTDESSGLTFKGTISEQDKDDGNVYGGFLVSADSFKASGKFLQSMDLEFGLDGTIEMTAASTSFTNSAKMKWTFKLGADGKTAGGIFGYYLDAKMTPTDFAAPETAGTVDSLSGFLVAKMEASSASSSKIDVTLSVVGDGLTYASSCSNSFKDGTITFTDGSGNKAVYTYADCDVKATYNGDALDISSISSISSAAIR